MKSKAAKKKPKRESSGKQLAAVSPPPNNLTIPAELLSVLPPEIKDQVQGANSGAMIAAASIAMSAYRGPFLPPQMLAEYEEVFPGWGKRLLELAEKQTQHRLKLEKSRVDGAERRMNLGQIFGFGIAILSIVSASTIIYLLPPSWPVTAFCSLLVAVGVGGPAVAKLLAEKFDWPFAKSKDKASSSSQPPQKVEPTKPKTTAPAASTPSSSGSPDAASTAPPSVPQVPR